MSQYEQMREAITKAEAVIDGTRMMVLQGQEYDIGLLDFDGALKMLRAALALPPRNCDVGTPDEHERRWRSNCGHGIPRCCKCAVYAEAKKLGLVNHRYLMKSDCKFVWAQMPYAEERKGEGDGK